MFIIPRCLSENVYIITVINIKSGITKKLFCVSEFREF